jgi:hypothetical protein
MIAIAVLAIGIAGMMSIPVLTMYVIMSAFTLTVPIWLVSRRSIPGPDGKRASIDLSHLLVLYAVFVTLFLIFVASIGDFIRRP